MSETNFKVFFIPHLGWEEGEGIFEKECETHTEAELVLNTIADYTLMLHDCSIMPDYSNMGWISRKDGGGWVEIDGNDL